MFSQAVCESFLLCSSAIPVNGYLNFIIFSPDDQMSANLLVNFTKHLRHYEVQETPFIAMPTQAKPSVVESTVGKGEMNSVNEMNIKQGNFSPS